MSTVLGRPPGLPSGISVLIISHCSSVKLVRYDVFAHSLYLSFSQLTEFNVAGVFFFHRSDRIYFYFSDILLEIIGHKDAIDYIESLSQQKKALGEWEIEQIHNLILRKIAPEEAGKYRQLMSETCKKIAE